MLTEPSQDATQAVTEASPQDETLEQARARHCALSPLQLQTYLDKLRRAASQGLIMHKTRVRDPRSRDYKGYTLVDADTGRIVLGRRPDGLLPELFDIDPGDYSGI